MEKKADKKAIADVMAGYAEALIQSDADLYCSLHDKDAEKMPQNGPWITGLSAVRDLFNRVSAEFEWRNARVDPMEIEVFGCFAYSRGSFIYDTIAKSDGTVARSTGKFLTVFKRQNDNAWKIYRDSYMFDTPAERPEG